MPTSSATAPAKPAATIHTMIICVPDEVPNEALTSTRNLSTHFGVAGATARRFWAAPLAPWQRRHMIDLRKGRPAYCAGGPVRLLDLPGLRHAAGMGAGLRQQQWTHVVRGTKAATPWQAHLARHHANPSKHSMDKAAAEFHAQPRVQAMAMHNAATHGGARLELGELEMLQAGAVAYQHYCALKQICGDALLTGDGTKLAPASDAFTDVIAYLDSARRHLDMLDGGQRLLAVTL